MQRIVDRLFCGIVPSSVGNDVRMVCAEEVNPPAGFENCWSTLTPDLAFDQQPWLEETFLTQVSVMVIVACFPDEGQKQAILSLGRVLRGHPLAAPPVILVPVLHNASQTTQVMQDYVQPLLKSASVDDVIWGSPSGFALALAVQAKLSNLDNQLNRLQESLQDRVDMLEARDGISNTIQTTQWQYLRTRLFHAIPPMRNDLEDYQQQSVAGLQVGRRISLGAFGAQHIACRQVEEQPGQVQLYNMFIIDKKQSKYSVYDLRAINRFVTVLGELNNFRHPNLSHLVATFHTPDRLCVVTEMCGRQTLFMRLKLRDRPVNNAAPVPLPTASMRSLMEQICSAVHHLHVVASMCHRDIKPENFTVDEKPDGGIHVKLGGFELAMVQSGTLRCKSSCGTIPFAPPEVVMAGNRGYDGMVADMWSVGVVFVEIACGLRKVEDMILEANGQDPANRTEKDGLLRPSSKTAKKMIVAFMQNDIIQQLFERAVPEAHELKGWLLPMVSSLVTMQPAKRPTAAMLQDFLP
mmetsp:Transcript_72284/g.182252  ORF Transcript_72284/g.182252 Transcript_72284/m.182252 type:complete len:522 (-) Transcript_72284:353-1918(-)